jgi:hypothetical protein
MALETGPAVTAAICAVLLLATAGNGMVWPQYHRNPFVIATDAPEHTGTEGGIIAADLTGDELPDYLLTRPGYVGAFRHDGSPLWSKSIDIRVAGQSESHGLPGHHGPGLQAGDVDADGKAEVVYLTQDGLLHIADGSTGEDKTCVRVPVPGGAERWEIAAIANLRGLGDCDVILQATNAEGYRMGRYLAAYAAEALGGEPLWSTGDYVGCAHNGLRLADIDGDGRDEVLGATVIGDDGARLLALPVRGHLDSIFVHDVLPDRSGLEVVALEEGGEEGNRVFLFGAGELIWETHYQHQEPQNAAVGKFDPDREGLQVWCRSRYNEHQKPFVFDARGELIAHWEMDDVAPKDWTPRGVEVIWTIDWTGAPKQLAAAKERHESGDVCVFDPLSGEFVLTIPEKADRLYVADVSGDWREELIVVAGSEIHIYHNEAPNKQPDRPRLWSQQHYRRSKMNWNYYSP